MTMRTLEQTPQGIGLVSTYMRRYQLAAMAGVAQYDDDAQSASKTSDQSKVRKRAQPAETTDHELRELTQELQSVMIETASDDKGRKVIESMSTEEFAKLIIEKKNHGNPLTKLVLNDLLKEEKAKAAKHRQIEHEKTKAKPTMRTDNFLALVDYVSSQAKMSHDDVEPHVISWLEHGGWTKLSLNKKPVADVIWAAAKTVDWTTIRTQQEVPA